ncbi:hypothetical protein Hypma_008076 [Hypsizygus marmoreus]|uniref:Uncharacterized protein n=1 Tax=Hypsizygus marmoreus TaxID=39966 RepID=A0A369JSD9_HYPMA|nr:hypothetical protein Hypma_008076 [Hypsizygus marmoreus]
MDKVHGRIVDLSQDTHCPGHSSLEKFPPGFPNNTDNLAKPPKDTPCNAVGRGFQRYGTSKPRVLMFIYELNRRLQVHYMTVAMDPGELLDSHAMSAGVPKAWGTWMKYILNPLLPVLKFMAPNLPSSSEADVTFIYIEANKFGSPESYDESKWEALWAKSVAWSGILKAYGYRSGDWLRRMLLTCYLVWDYLP